jgi:hypothetical protein
VDIEIIDFCISRVDKYLGERIEILCKSIEEGLTSQQLAVLTSETKAELFDKHWGKRRRTNPLSQRKR